MSNVVFNDSYVGPRWTYGLTYRPAGYASVPNGWVLGSVRPHEDFRHGIIDYPFELPDKDVNSYELTLISSPA